ncbi:MAG: hypothetical protein ABJA11_11560 [Pseudolysinimonas sp.]
MHGPFTPATVQAILGTTDGSQYGHQVGVAIKACKSYQEGTLCSANWSSEFILGTPVNNSIPGALSATLDAPQPIFISAGVWSWGSSPSGDYTSMQYSCDNGNTWIDITLGAAGSCHATGPRLGSPADLLFRIQADGIAGGFVRSYSWTDYN